jgi:hypothetical protein
VRRVAFVALAVAALGVTGFASAGAGVNRFTLTLRVIGPGAVTAKPGGRCAGYLTRVHSCTRVYAGGTKVKLTAVPQVNAKLSSWRGSGIGGGSTRAVAMTSPKLVTATFVKVPVPKPPPPPPPAGSSRGNPLPLGANLGIVVNDEHWTLRIISTQPDATAAVLAENQFNDPPAPGNQFFIATVQVTYVSGTKSEDPGFQIVSDLNTVGPSNVVYTSFGSSSRCGVIPDDIDLKGDLLPGGSMTANTCWQVPSAEAGSLIAFYDFSAGPFWMALR